jgi:gp16 family phage-associated protein
MSTPEKVRERMRSEGKTLRQWAEENGFNPGSVYRVMGGINKGHYGKAHEIAAALGIKPAPDRRSNL